MKCILVTIADNFQSSVALLGCLCPFLYPSTPGLQSDFNDQTCHLGKGNKDNKAVIHPALICAKEKNKARWGNIDMWSGCYFNCMVSYRIGYKAIFFPIFFILFTDLTQICALNTILNPLNKHTNKKMLFGPLKDLWITDSVYKCLCARHTRTYTVLYTYTHPQSQSHVCTVKIRLLCRRLLIALRHEEDILKASHSNRTTIHG